MPADHHQITFFEAPMIPTTNTNYCKNCDQTKPLDQFSPRISPFTGCPFYTRVCKACNAKVARDWYERNKSHAKTRMKAYSQANLHRFPVGSNNRGRPKRLIIDGKLVCGCCHENKPIEQFSPLISSPSGRANACQECCVKRSDARRLKRRAITPK